MSGWQEVKLNTVTSYIKRGVSPKYVETDGCTVINQKCIRDNRVTYKDSKLLNKTQRVAKEKYLQDGDVLVNSTGTGTLGRVARYKAIDGNVFCDSHVSIVRANKLIDKKFLSYYLSYSEPMIENYGKGATNQIELSSYDLGLLKINLPPLPTQLKIAKILSNYDDLIENNLKRIKLLEESARLTYEEWFLRFKIDGKKLEINPETSLPFGWKKNNLGDYVNNYDNQRRPLSKLVREGRPGNYPYYGAASVLDHIDDFIFDGKYLLVGEDGTVITKNGTPMLQFINCKFWVSNHAHILTGKNISTEFLYLALNVYPVSNYITGAAQPKINQQNLNRIPVVIADERTRADFDSFIIPIFEQIFNLKDQNQLLKEARDILLPRLMTGMIDTDEMDIAV